MKRRVGLWLIGAFGSVGGATAVGLAALARGLTNRTGMVTALPQFAAVDFDEPGCFVLGGHDVRASSLFEAARELHDLAGVIPAPLLQACAADLEAWSGNVRPGMMDRLGTNVLHGVGDKAGTNVQRVVSDRVKASAWCMPAGSPQAALEQVRNDLQAFREAHQLDQVVVVNVASTEPPVERPPGFIPEQMPASSLYAWAAVAAGCPYVNFTPSLGGSFTAFEEHCLRHRVPHAGQDAKTGETLVKSVLAPMFALRNLHVLSWVGHNMLGNRDGRTLADPAPKAAKLKNKDALLADLLGHTPQTHTSIEFIESLHDWKTAWDLIHFEGFLGTRMQLHFTWQGCDSLLAAPLVLDLARLLLLAQRRGHAGVLPAAACFFKQPIGFPQHELALQFRALADYLLDPAGTTRLLSPPATT